MYDIETKIYRPVALPQRFLGAPSLPAIFSMLFNIFVYMSFIGFDLEIEVGIATIVFLISLTGNHIILIKLGSIDPHLTTMMQTMRFSNIKTKRIGGKYEKIFEA